MIPLAVALSLALTTYLVPAYGQEIVEGYITDQGKVLIHKVGNKKINEDWNTLKDYKLIERQEPLQKIEDRFDYYENLVLLFKLELNFWVTQDLVCYNYLNHELSAKCLPLTTGERSLLVGEEL